MPRLARHARITPLPVPEPIAAGRLDSFSIFARGQRTDAILEYHAYLPEAAGDLFEQNGKIFERTHGLYLPRRLRFLGIEKLEQHGLYLNPNAIPPDHAARIIAELLSWKSRNERLYFFLLYGSSEGTDLFFHAHTVKLERRSGIPIAVTFERDWSPPPSLPARLVPQPGQMYKRFGGDPIAIHINGETHQRQLFIGSLESQPQLRPDVHAVLNLGEQPSRWALASQSRASDRWAIKGEGSSGMNVDEIRAEAMWGLEHLQNRQRLLVHCMAGMDRSATICCAILILLEGLTAEQALERVRKHHPWARPGNHHWILLRWLAGHHN